VRTVHTIDTTSREVAFVTGGTGLIGRAVVQRLLDRGVSVVLMLRHGAQERRAGDYPGTFTESMFEEGQKLPHAYHRSKFESEKLVRESGFDYRIYRPSSVVGDSMTGEIDQIDGIYYAFGAIQKLAAAMVHNAARSIRRPATDAIHRFHDYERTMTLNYFSPVRLTLRLLPSLRERGGIISHVLTMGVLVPGPYFGAYLASKAALDAFGDSLAAEVHHDGVHVSSVYLPLVKTEMVAPTEEYAGRVDIMTSENAALMIVDGIVDRKRRVMTIQGRLCAVFNRMMLMATSDPIHQSRIENRRSPMQVDTSQSCMDSLGSSR